MRLDKEFIEFGLNDKRYSLTREQLESPHWEFVEDAYVKSVDCYKMVNKENHCLVLVPSKYVTKN